MSFAIISPDVQLFSVTLTGDWPLFDKVVSTDCTVDVTADTDGAASLSEWRFHYADGDSNLVSNLITTITPDSDQVRHKHCQVLTQLI